MAELKPSLLSLPHDVRYLIYQHAFPAGRQIYVQASPSALRSITNDPIPTSILLACRALNYEAGEYLYNRYLFNLVGRKQDCLKSYDKLEKTMRKYTKSYVHVDAFSNGDHSSTMAIALHAGEGKVEMLKRRERGLPKTIRELTREIGGEQVYTRPSQWASIAMALLVLAFALVSWPFVR